MTTSDGADLRGITKIDRAEYSSPAVLVARKLLAYLLESGQARVGQKLPAERQLVEIFGVGRSSVREALKSLSLLGLLEVRQGDGTYVRSPSSDLLPQVIEWGLVLSDHKTAEMLEARRVIEAAIAELAATRRTGDDLALMKTHLDGMRDTIGSAQEWVGHDVQFHLAVAAAAHNSALADYLFRLRSLVGAWITKNQLTSGGTQDKYEEHKAVYDAIESGDAALSRLAMSRHLDQVSDRLEAATGSPLI